MNEPGQANNPVRLGHRWVRGSVVDTGAVDRAVAAVKSVAATLQLSTDKVTVIQNSNKLALRLLPCDVFARVARIGQEVAALEIDIAQQLAAADAPAVAPDPRADPRVYRRDGFAITWWTHHDPRSAGLLSPADYASALGRLHVGMRSVDIVTPHFLDRVSEAENLVTNQDQSPALDEAGRELLLDTFSSVRELIDRAGAVEQLLHGEPHPGNILNTPIGPLFIDFETCCRGPIEFDVAHVPAGVAERYPDLDEDLLRECRRLVLAMVAAWRWDTNDEFPDGLRHGRNILELLGADPPWPTILDLDSM